MDRYQRVEKPKQESVILENEIRVTTQGLIRNYITYAASLIQEKKAPEISLKAMGQAISKTVAVAEILKRRIPGLHQVTEISSASIVDVWEPIEEGLLPLETTRHVSMISITLSGKELDTSLPGYQPPSAVEQVKKANTSPSPNGDIQGGMIRGRGRVRGRARGWGGMARGWPTPFNANNLGWGRGLGRSPRGRGRQMNNMFDPNGYNNGYNNRYNNGNYNGYNNGYNNGNYNGYNNASPRYNNASPNANASPRYNNSSPNAFRGRGKGQMRGRGRAFQTRAMVATEAAA